jgi:hypothetical protein
MIMYLVTYAKIVEDKQKGLFLDSVCLGGLGVTEADADEIARQCASTIKGATIIPKIIPVSRRLQAIDLLYDASDQFEKLAAQMIEADMVISKNANRRKK